MLLTHRKVGAVIVAELQAAYLDQSNSGTAERFLTALVGPGANLIVDLSRVEWMDSSSCCALIVLLKRIKEAEGSLKLCALTPPVRTLFELTQMHKIVDIFNSLDEALRASQV